jgi:hypothetical protein
MERLAFGGAVPLSNNVSTFRRFAARGDWRDVVALPVADNVLRALSANVSTFRGDGV